MGFKMAEYKRGKGVIETKDFTDNARVNFEPAFHFMDDNEDYIVMVNEFRDLCPGCISDYVKMLFLDTVCANAEFGNLFELIETDFTEMTISNKCN